MLAPGFRGISPSSSGDSGRKEQSFGGEEVEKENTRRNQGKMSLSRTQLSDLLLLQPPPRRHTSKARIL